MNINKLVNEYLNSRPLLLEVLKLGVLNYSKLARQIIRDLTLKTRDFDAVLIALRRINRKAKSSKLENKIKNVIKNSRMDISTKMMVVILEKSTLTETISKILSKIKKQGGTITFVEGSQAKTLITEDTHKSLIKKDLKSRIISLQENTAKITIKSPKEIETTPGVVSYIYSLFSKSGVNIIQTLSCYTDSIFIVQEDDVSNVMRFLKI